MSLQEGISDFTSSPFGVNGKTQKFPDLITLYEPADHTHVIVDILLVHGLMDNTDRTWLYEDVDTTVFWPYDLLSKHFPGARISAFNYERNVINFCSKIHKYAGKLLMALSELRKETKTNMCKFSSAEDESYKLMRAEFGNWIEGIRPVSSSNAQNSARNQSDPVGTDLPCKNIVWARRDVLCGPSYDHTRKDSANIDPSLRGRNGWSELRSQDGYAPSNTIYETRFMAPDQQQLTTPASDAHSNLASSFDQDEDVDTIMVLPPSPTPSDYGTNKFANFRDNCQPDGIHCEQNEREISQEHQGSVEQTQSVDSDRFHCDVEGCKNNGGRGFGRKCHLNEHRKVAHSNATFHCPITGCGDKNKIVFHSPKTLYWHLKRVHKVPLECGPDVYINQLSKNSRKGPSSASRNKKIRRQS
ncbi:hypothetical protein B7463_g3299, partial [Scytalidium lignicola]